MQFIISFCFIKVSTQEFALFFFMMVDSGVFKIFFLFLTTTQRFPF